MKVISMFGNLVKRLLGCAICLAIDSLATLLIILKINPELGYKVYDVTGEYLFQCNVGL